MQQLKQPQDVPGSIGEQMGGRNHDLHKEPEVVRLFCHNFFFQAKLLLSHVVHILTLASPVYHKPYNNRYFILCKVCGHFSRLTTNFDVVLQDREHVYH
jgi:hypothetical protein